MKPQTGAGAAPDKNVGKGKNSGRGLVDSSADVAAVASLEEPTRRRIYDHVGAQEQPVSREDVAIALGVPRRTAASSG